MSRPECGDDRIVDGVHSDRTASSSPEPRCEANSDAAPKTDDLAVVAESGARKKRGRRGCFLGCLGTLVGLLLIALMGAGWFLHWPEKLGLVASPAEKLFEQSPNPWAAQALKAELSKQGVPVKGVTFYVLQSEDSTGSFAYVLIEDSRGAKWTLSTHEKFRSAVEGFLVLTATTKAAKEYGIERIAVDHRNAENLQVAVLTAKTRVLREYAAGAISQQELFDQMDGYADVGGFIRGMIE